jgi:hypothetical protein
MNIQPLPTYSLAEYPSMDEVQQHPHLLQAIPKRWGRSKRLAALFGLGLLSHSSLSSEEGTSAPNKAPSKVPFAATQSATTASKTEGQQVQKASSLVAPFLADAIHFDGRGSFGCVAVNPPTFLAEDEAMEIIRKELEAVGLKLKEGEELKGVEMPLNGKRINIFKEEEKKDVEIDEFGEERRKLRFAATEFSFDFADPEKSIYIEYLSARDHSLWDATIGRSSVSSYNFPRVAQIFADSLQKRKSDKKTVFGVFFDPMPGVSLEGFDAQGLTDEQSKLARKELAREEELQRATLQTRGQEKLRAQIRHFISFLRKEGLLEKSGS